MALALASTAWVGTMSGSGKELGLTRASEGRAHRPTVLVVDDDEGLRTLVRSMLRLGGYEVLSASDAEEALVLAEAHAGTLDLLLTDIIMPGLQGPELAQRLQAVHPSLRVLLMTGATNAPPTALRKPFGVSALLAAVRSALIDNPR
jgi:two-component system, cell cycle sensor histidine kinase and response regulator CckA